MIAKITPWKSHPEKQQYFLEVEELEITTLVFETLEEICELGKAIQDAAIRQMMIEAGIGAFAKTPTLPVDPK